MKTWFWFWRRREFPATDKKVRSRIRTVVRASERDIALAALLRADPALADALEDIGKLCEAKRLALGHYRRARHVEVQDSPPTADLPFVATEKA